METQNHNTSSVPLPLPAKRDQLLFNETEILESIDAEADPILKQTLMESFQEHKQVITYANVQEAKVAKFLEENRLREQQQMNEIVEFKREQQQARREKIKPLMQFLSTYNSEDTKVISLKKALQKYVDNNTAINYSILIPWEKVQMSSKVRNLLDEF